jgi:transposase
MDKKAVFKKYEMHQPLLLPPSIEELIPENHIVRVLNDVVENMDLDFLYKCYEGGGASSFHPEMMLKVLIYAYTQKIFSCRNIAKALRENINFMWLSGNNRPDFRTINRFRLKIQDSIDDIFSELLQFLSNKGYITLSNYFIDGTKIEANANKYSYVWRKSTARYKNGLQNKVRQLLEEIDMLNEEENNNYGDKDLEELGEDALITSEMLEQTVSKINEKINKNNVEKKSYKKAKTKIEKD